MGIVIQYIYHTTPRGGKIEKVYMWIYNRLYSLSFINGFCNKLARGLS